MTEKSKNLALLSFNDDVAVGNWDQVRIVFTLKCEI